MLIIKIFYVRNLVNKISQAEVFGEIGYKNIS